MKIQAYFPAFPAAFFLLTALSPAAEAIVSVAYIDPAENPPSSCVLIYPEESGNICSGNIIGRDKFLTAGHCAQKDSETAIIQCQDQTARFVRGMKIHPLYHEESPLFDLALLQAESDFRLEPARLPKSSAAAPALIEEGECAAFGFGLNSAGSFGELLGGPVFAAVNQSLGRETAAFGGPSNIQSGDSGGGLFCRSSGAGKKSWILTAVLSKLTVIEGEAIGVASILAGAAAGWISRHLDKDLPAVNGFQPAAQLKTAPEGSMESQEACVSRLVKKQACAQNTPLTNALSSEILRQCGLTMPQSHLKALIESGRAAGATCAEDIPESLAESLQSIREDYLWEAGYCGRLASDYKSSPCGNCEKNLAACLKSSASEREAARQTLSQSDSIFDLLAVLFMKSGERKLPYPPACIKDFESSSLYAGIKNLCRINPDFCNSENDEFKSKAISAMDECAAEAKGCESHFHFCMIQAKDSILAAENIFKGCAGAFANRIYENKKAAYELPRINAALCIERRIDALKMAFRPEASIFLEDMKTAAAINYYSLNWERCGEIITEAAGQSRWLEERLPQAIDLHCERHFGLRPDMAPDGFGGAMDYNECASRLGAKGLAKAEIARECVLRNFDLPLSERLWIFGLSDEHEVFLEGPGDGPEKGKAYRVSNGMWVKSAEKPSSVAEANETCFLGEGRIIKIAGFSPDGRRALIEGYIAAERPAGTACPEAARFILPVEGLNGLEGASFTDRTDAQLNKILDLGKRIIDPFLPNDWQR